jgi:hypothetical protein
MKAMLLYAMMAGAALAARAADEAAVTVDRNGEDRGFRFERVPPPMANDAAQAAEFTLLDGRRNGNGAGLAALHDGDLPDQPDQPAKNFFLAGPGMLHVDLRRLVGIAYVSTYSWHPGERGPQVYTLYGTENETPDCSFAKKGGTAAGWRKIARVDTRASEGGKGGQYGVRIAPARRGQTLGKFRHLLFKIEPTGEGGNAQTFWSEIDVADADGPELRPSARVGAARKAYEFDSVDKQYHFVLDYTAAPELEAWGKQKLAPVMSEWYPRIARELASEGFQPSREFRVRFKDDMGGVPAYAAGPEICVNHPWVKGELNREGLGCVVHEMVHIVQAYGRGPNRAPGWVCEGIADYVRWFEYEPQAKGAVVKKGWRDARHDASYRITANFLDWCCRTYDKALVQKLNAAARGGQYDEALWKTWTGKTLAELGAAWKDQLPD